MTPATHQDSFPETDDEKLGRTTAGRQWIEARLSIRQGELEGAFSRQVMIVMTSATRGLFCLMAAFSLVGCQFLRGYTEGRSNSLQPFNEQALPTVQRGAARFLFDDFGALSTDTLETNAVPWKLVAAALVLQHWPLEVATDVHLREVLTGFGFIFPASVGNWPMAEQPEFRMPLGLISGDMQRNVPRVQVEVANLGCSSCHSGVTYDAAGVAQPVAWLGLPNTSLDLDAYVDAVLGALRASLKDQERVFVAVRQLFPQVSEAELRTLRKFVWPKLVDRLAGGGSGLPFRNGGPGRSNGVEALKYQFHLAPGAHPFAAGVSIPQVGGYGLRWSVLSDGIYTRRGDPRFQPRTVEEAAAPARTAEIVAFFTVPTMGLHPDKARQAIEPVSEVLTYLAGYESPQYPGVIDKAAAARGAVVYARCAGCHGEYVERNGRMKLQSFPNRLSPLAEMGTDSARLDAVNEAVIRAVRRSPMGRFIDAEQTQGYVAPSLAGIWATAPYLHNGSIPTLAALMSPAERPAKFWVGGHKLDFVKLGIAGELNARGEWAYPAGYVPWSTPHLFDTAQIGHSNRGHEREFDGLAPADKTDLIEFLKQL